MNENDKLKELLSKGYRIEGKNPNAKKFNEKYAAYRFIHPLGKRYAVLDENGNIIAEQG